MNERDSFRIIASDIHKKIKKSEWNELLKLDDDIPYPWAIPDKDGFNVWVPIPNEKEK